MANRFERDLTNAHQGATGDATEVPALSRALTSSENKVVVEIRERGKSIAEGLGMAPELLSRKRDIEGCVQHYLISGELSPLYSGWRHSLLGQDLAASLQKLRSSTAHAS